MKIFYVNNFLPGFKAITLWPLGLISKGKLTATQLNHEAIHWQQQKEMGGVLFYVWYFIEWFIKFFRYGSGAYYEISFEREAYKNQKNLKYISVRGFWMWVSYVFYRVGRS